MMLEKSGEWRVASGEIPQPLPQSEADLLIYCENPLRAAVICPACQVSGFRADSSTQRRNRRTGLLSSAPGSSSCGCSTCEGAGYLGIDGMLLTSCKAGSEGKVAVLAARYAQGRPLWLSGDLDLRDVIPQCGPMQPSGEAAELVRQAAEAAEFGDSFEDELIADAA